jgi:hypothetical protein
MMIQESQQVRSHPPYCIRETQLLQIEGGDNQMVLMLEAVFASATRFESVNVSNDLVWICVH